LAGWKNGLLKIHIPTSVSMVERLTGHSVGNRERDVLTHGADEIDLVRSGLEDTMVNAYDQIREIYKKKKTY
jgi:glutamate dehydrogenase (NAD(P)+)